MFEQFEVPIFYQEHAKRIERVQRSRLRPSSDPVRLTGPRVFAAEVLLRLSAWLAPEEVERAGLGKTVTA